MLGSSMGPRMALELRPQGPDPKYTHHIDQHEKLKGLDVKESTKGPNWPWWKVDSSSFLFRFLFLPIERKRIEIEIVTGPADAQMSSSSLLTREGAPSSQPS